MAAAKPPRYVPTLTEVVLPGAASAEQRPPQALVWQEQMIGRVMGRLDESLERRIREAIASVVLEQTRSLAPRLREELESVVRQTVQEAVAEELAARSAPPR